MTSLQVGEKLVALCRQGQNLDAIKTLYDPGIVSVEAMASTPEFAQTITGIDGVLAKNQWWIANHEMHGGEILGPFPHGDRFAVLMKYDVTPKVGPMAGKRMAMEEIALYTVKNDKIVREEFFYTM